MQSQTHQDEERKKNNKNLIKFLTMQPNYNANNHNDDDKLHRVELLRLGKQRKTERKKNLQRI